MKGLLVFLLGAVCGAFAWQLYLEHDGRVHSPSDGVHAVKSGASTAVDKTRDAASNVSGSIGDKLRDWKLTPDDIKADLARGGDIVRSKAAVAGDKISDGRIVAVIKAKFLLDRDLSAIDINVDCRDGRVTLRGTVASADLVGKATALALDTNGVTNVQATLAIK